MKDKTLFALTGFLFATSLFTSWVYISRNGFDDAWSILAVVNPIILIFPMLMFIRRRK